MCKHPEDHLMKHVGETRRRKDKKEKGRGERGEGKIKQRRKKLYLASSRFQVPHRNTVSTLSGNVDPAISGLSGVRWGCHIWCQFIHSPYYLMNKKEWKRGKRSR